jgi:hypothetical protein
VSQIHEVYDAASGEFRGFKEKTGQGALNLNPSSAFLVCGVANGFTQGYDISFLITNFHSDTMLKHKIVDFIIQLRLDSLPNRAGPLIVLLLP